MVQVGRKQEAPQPESPPLSRGGVNSFLSVTGEAKWQLFGDEWCGVMTGRPPLCTAAEFSLISRESDELSAARKAGIYTGREAREESRRVQSVPNEAPCKEKLPNYDETFEPVSILPTSESDFRDNPSFPHRLIVKCTKGQTSCPLTKHKTPTRPVSVFELVGNTPKQGNSKNGNSVFSIEKL